MTHWLFICSRNRLRSPTAEVIFGEIPGIETASAGLAPDAEMPLGQEELEWADVIFVMERKHKKKLEHQWRNLLKGKSIVCLSIPDEFDFMQPELIEVLRKQVKPYLPFSLEKHFGDP